MKAKRLWFDEGFRVVPGNGRSQAAEMVIPPGDAEGGPGNRHAGADQWLFVTAGLGEAVVDGKRVDLAPGTLLFIERGERHEVRNTSHAPLRTLNFYVPPAYAKDGKELAAAKPRSRVPSGRPA
jgi:mannose-6-phosphate isomerase-like protein (cupin superfamily)